MSVPNLVSDVFTPGRQPSVTYNPRANYDLEGSIEKYLRNRGSALVVSGPTKSGKTVIVEKVLPRYGAVWVTGSDLRSVDDLWDAVIEYLNLFDQLSVQDQSSGGTTGKVGGKIGVLGVAELSGELGANNSDAQSITKTVSRSRSSVAREGLRTLAVPVIIDDFHYVDDGLKVELTRTIKGLIPYIPVVMIAVPQDAFKAVRAETDMVGRVWQLEIEPWDESELQYIAETGFQALNVVDDKGEVAAEFARHSLGAPFLMQQLCLEYCLSTGIEETESSPRPAHLPNDLLRFYRDIASRYVPGVFDALRMGPRTKGQPRLARKLKDGASTDIYGAVLYGISKMGPVRSMTTQQLVRKIGDHFEESPRVQNVASALGHMTTIADANRKGSDAVLDYKDDILYVADPFLSFYLRFGRWELPKPPEDAI